MKGPAAIVVSALLVISLVGMTAIVLADDSDNADSEPAASEVAPGEQLSGVVGVQHAETEGDLDERNFATSIDNADTDEAKAAVVSGQVSDIEDRLAELSDRKDALDEAKENGEISEGKYQAEIAKLAVERGTAERLADQSATVADGLPAGILAANGIDVESIHDLREQARELGGPEVAEIARSIAGPNTGEGPPERAGGQRGPP